MAAPKYPPVVEGATYGRLTVISAVPRQGREMQRWLCHCSCGKQSTPQGVALKNGTTKSCGCLRAERAVETQHVHGHAARDGLQSPTYKTWSSMIQRCTNPTAKRYEHYGGRGIQVCQRWRDSFEAFLTDMGERPPGRGYSIDRVDNDGHYEASNCRWATRDQQANNTSRCRYFMFNGTRMTLKQVACAAGVKYETLRHRLNRGRSLDSALYAPPYSRR